jgi:polysaccharide biosynthesis transport protein
VKAILRALWGRRLVVIISVIASLIGGVVVMLTSQPRYQGSARVVLDYIRPDPNTGAVLPSKMLDAYIASQISLLRDFQVSGPAVEAMGFLDNPDVQAAYYANPPPDGRDLHQWIAAQVGAATGGRMVEDSNILEIIYIASSPELAEAVVDALRASYIESSAAQTRKAAESQSEFLAARIESAKASLASLVAMQNRYEDETGLRMGETGRDEESAKLEQLLRRDRAPVLEDSGRLTAGTILLRQLDAEIAEASTVLGVNNPQLLAMRQRRIALQAQAEAEGARVGSSAKIAEASDRANAAMVEQQMAKVLAAREPTLRLRLMQDEINRQRDQINKMTEGLVRSRTLAGADTTNTTPIGPPSSKKKPVFPNKPLILGGSAGLGLIAGCLLALFIELMGRRIRAVTDLEASTGVPVLGAIPDYARKPKSRGRARRAGPPPATPVEAPLPPTALAAE